MEILPNVLDPAYNTKTKLKTPRRKQLVKLIIIHHSQNNKNITKNNTNFFYKYILFFNLTENYTSNNIFNKQLFNICFYHIFLNNT